MVSVAQKRGEGKEEIVLEGRSAGKENNGHTVESLNYQKKKEVRTI